MQLGDDTQKTQSDISQRMGLTFKSALAALGVIILINAFAFFNMNTMRQGDMIGNFLPLAVYFAFFLLACIWNPLAGRFCRALLFDRRETAVFFILVLVGCWSPTSGLYRYFHRVVIAPVYFEPAKADWKACKVREMLPDKLFPHGGDMYAAATPAAAAEGRDPQVVPATGSTIYAGMIQGLNLKSDTMLGSLGEMSEVISAWGPPMRYWGPLLLFFVLTILSFSLIFHRQWSKHEQLTYPLVQIASSLIEREEGRSCGRMLSSKLFWAGFSLPAFIYSLQVINAWFPGSVPAVSLQWTVPWAEVFPVVNQAGCGWQLSQGRAYFCVIGCAYFVAAEVSLTIGVAPLLFALVSSQFYLATGSPLANGELDIARFGAYVSYGIMLAWAGRDYYGRVFVRALGLRRGGGGSEGEADGVWAARFFMVFFAGMLLVMMLMGFDWLTALLFAATHLLIFTVIARIVCEAGTPFLQPFSSLNVLGGILTKLFGAAFMGAKPLVFFNWLGAALAQDPRECLMPYAANAFKLGEVFQIKLRKFFFVLAVFLCIGLVVAFMASLYCCYRFGGQNDQCPQSIQASIPALRFLEDTGQRAASDAASGLWKLSLIDFDQRALVFFAVGLIITSAFFLLRFRFTSFPLHPLLFIVWNTYPITLIWSSYLIGWAIKMLVVNFGGGKVYQELKPIFLGLIIGELVAAGVAIAIGCIYYGLTGINPVAISILPG